MATNKGTPAHKGNKATAATAAVVTAAAAPAALLAAAQAANMAATGRAAGNIAATAAANPQVLALAVAAGLAVAPMVGAPVYKPLPPKAAHGGYRAAAVALANALYTATGGKGYTALQFKAALVTLAPASYRGGQWHTWLPANAWWQVVATK